MESLMQQLLCLTFTALHNKTQLWRGEKQHWYAGTKIISDIKNLAHVDPYLCKPTTSLGRQMQARGTKLPFILFLFAPTGSAGHLLYLLPRTTSSLIHLSFINYGNTSRAWWGCRTRLVWSGQRDKERERENISPNTSPHQSFHLTRPCQLP